MKRSMRYNLVFFILSVLFVLMLALVILVSPFNVDNTLAVEANSSVVEVQKPMPEIKNQDFENGVEVKVDEACYKLEDVICISYKFPTKIIMLDLNYEQNGFVVEDFLLSSDYVVDVKLSVKSGMERPVFRITYSKQNRVVERAIYGFATNDHVFISTCSDVDAEENYYNFAYAQGWMSFQEMQDKHDALFYRISTKKYENRSNNIRSNNILTTFYWEDRNEVSHPLAFTKIDVLVYNSSSLVRTINDGTDYTGLLSCEVTDVFTRIDLIIHARGDNAGVQVYSRDANGTDYPYSRRVKNWDMSTSEYTIHCDTDYGRAQCVSQAFVYAKRYVQAMSGVWTTSAKAVYPSPSNHGTSYDPVDKIIYIQKTATDPDWFDWDVIMHEYGHHVAKVFELDDYIGGEHLSSENLVERYGKNRGIHMAWGEAWATIFAELAQQYYQSELTNIERAVGGVYSDISYDANGNEVLHEYSLNSITIDIGEGCEASIMGVLWDLFDSDNNEEHDQISLGHEGFWNVVVNSNNKSFSKLASYYYQQYPSLEDKSKFGKLIEYYGMSPKMIDVENTNNPNINPTLNWVRNGSSPSLQNSISYVDLYSEDLSQTLRISPSSTATSVTLSSTQWNTVLSWSGEHYYIAITGTQMSGPVTGPYMSGLTAFSKPVYITEAVSGGVRITGAYCPLVGNITIPAKINGLTVKEIGFEAFKEEPFTIVYFEDYTTVTYIGARAFYRCNNLAGFRLPDNIATIESETFAYGQTSLVITYYGSTLTHIGTDAFRGANLAAKKDIFPTVTHIGNGAFWDTTLSSDFKFGENSQLVSIGADAFRNNNFKDIIIPSTVTNIGARAFAGGTTITFYVEASSKPTAWSSSWNYSNRPVIWGSVLSSNKEYVKSFNKTATSISNPNASGGILNPSRKGYNFGGWYTTSNYSGNQYMNLATAPNGWLYAKWNKKSCVAEGTLITLADGSQVAVEDLTGDENLLVWNMLTGQFDSAPILFIDSDPYMEYEIIHLYFSDGTEVKVIDEHAFWDFDLNEYVFMRNDAAQYIGHWYNKQTEDTDGNMIWTQVQLVDVEVYNEYTTAWSPVTYSHLCFYVNGMLSMPGATEGLINIFEVDSTTMQYDMDAYYADIEEYGLFTYEEFNELIPVPEVVFDAFNGQYLKVSIGKGLTTIEELGQLIERYSEFFSSTEQEETTETETSTEICFQGLIIQWIIELDIIELVDWALKLWWFY